ncbi:hypothetical protein BDR26DRAFT_824740 [Obelidium mucronatum]|nr:hypothetical protein BDR26DRAFT_824740 [Obelidium mucronatum]
MKDASKPDTQWSINKYFINERETLSSHKSALFTSIPMDEFKHTFQGGDTTGIPYSPLLQAVSEKVDDFVTGKVREKGVRLRTAVSSKNISTSGRWNGNFCIANEYLHGKQITGFHADSLAYIGPRPVIVSLSLGATRKFRVRKIKGVTVRNVPNTISSTNSDTTYLIKLPHGSLLIMYPPMQELYKHEIGPEKNFPGHPISGLARYNLTFRMYRPEFSMPPFCKCNIRTDLKPVFKRSASLDAQQEKEDEEKYYYACVKGRGGQLGCGFFSMKPFMT